MADPRDEQEDLRARCSTVAVIAMALEPLTRFAGNVGDDELLRMLATSHGQALAVLVRLRKQLRAGRGRAGRRVAG